MMRFRFGAVLGISVVVLAGLIVLLSRSGPAPTATSGSNGASSDALVLYCAAGLEPPVAEIIKNYEAANSITFQTQYGGSGTLLSQIRVAGGDIFIAADKTYLISARQLNLCRRISTIATQRPVIVVAKGNPKKIHKLEDLLQSDVRLSLADPKMAAIGQAVQYILRLSTLWDQLWKKAVIHRETVNQVANDVKLTAADAGIVWDATAKQYPDLEVVKVQRFEYARNEIAVGRLSNGKNGEAASRFINYVLAPDKGLAVFHKYGYSLWDGEPPQELEEEGAKAKQEGKGQKTDVKTKL
jgi:molybdate transport system substrate-binding protein